MQVTASHPEDISKSLNLWLRDHNISTICLRHDPKIPLQSDLTVRREWNVRIKRHKGTPGLLSSAFEYLNALYDTLEALLLFT